MPMLPPAPGRFSITKLCPSLSLSRSAMMRVSTSVEPPAGSGTTMRTRRSGHLRVEILVDREVADGGGPNGVAVGLGLRDRVDADVAAGAGAVLDHEALPELVLEPLRDDAGEHVRRAARRIGHDDAHEALG